MAIKFICTCGKHLRARDEMAARRSFCPRCGAPVGIPSQQPTQRGTEADPMTPAERMRTRRNADPQPWAAPGLVIRELSSGAPASGGSYAPGDDPSAPAVPAVPDPQQVWRPPADPGATRVELVRKRPRRRAGLETHWSHCFLYPFSAIQLLGSLALGLTVLTGGTALLLPRMIDLRLAPLIHSFLCLPYALIPLGVVGYVWGWLESVLASAATGDIRYSHWPGRNLGFALQSGARWLACFLAGPVVFAAAGLLYWVHCGDLTLLDLLILGELSLLAVGYWLFVLTAVGYTGRLSSIHPGEVVGLAHRLGARAVAAALIAWALALAHGSLAGVALRDLHGAAAGWVLLFACCFSLLFSTTFLFRLLGTWLRRTPAIPAAPPA